MRIPMVCLMTIILAGIGLAQNASPRVTFLEQHDLKTDTGGTTTTGEPRRR